MILEPLPRERHERDQRPLADAYDGRRRVPRVVEGAQEKHAVRSVEHEPARVAHPLHRPHTAPVADLRDGLVNHLLARLCIGFGVGRQDEAVREHGGRHGAHVVRG